MAQNLIVESSSLLEVNTQALENEAKETAKKYNVDTTRILNILQKTILTEDRLKSLNLELEEGFSLEDGPVFLPSISDALQYLDPEEALRLFESEDLNKLAIRELFTRSLYESDHPFFTLQELVTITEKFIAQLEYNKDHIIKTGYPKTNYVWYPLIEDHINNLYWVKRPVSISISRSAQDPSIRNVSQEEQEQAPVKPNYFIEYNWGKPTDGKGSALSYEEANFIEGFEQDDIRRLEKEREKLLDIKIKVLHEILKALRCRDARNLWQKCLKVLTEELMADDVEFYKDIDHLYCELFASEELKEMVPREALGQLNDESISWDLEDDYSFPNGGLASVLILIAHYEMQIKNQLNTKMKYLLKDIIDFDWLGRAKLTTDCYYQAFNEKTKEYLDYALKLLIENDEMENAFWKDYLKRVNTAIEEEFDVFDYIPIRAKRKDVNQCVSAIVYFSSLFEHNLKIYGKVPLISIIPEKGNTERFVFKQKGAMYQVRYEGEEYYINSTQGANYIQYILRNPYQEIPATQIVSAFSKDNRDYGVKLWCEPKVKNEEEDDGPCDYIDGIVPGYDSGDKMDEDAIRNYKNRLKQIDKLLQKAKKDNNLCIIEELTNEREAIEEHLRSSTYFKDKSKKFDSDSENARQTVSKSINGVYKNIQEDSSAPSGLLSHFKNSIHISKLCTYNPDRPIDWEF